MKKIQLSRGKVALVDDIDYARVSRFKWSALPQKHTCYAQRRSGYKWIMLHRFIMEAGSGQIVDHVDNNGLNCTRKNLRFCSASQNAINAVRKTRSHIPFRGVVKRKNRFQAKIGYRNRYFYLGSFVDPQDAARAYDAKALKLFGPFARLNFPQWFFLKACPSPQEESFAGRDDTV